MPAHPIHEPEDSTHPDPQFGGAPIRQIRCGNPDCRWWSFLPAVQAMQMDCVHGEGTADRVLFQAALKHLDKIAEQDRHRADPTA